MDFRAPGQELADKENQGIPGNGQDGEAPRVVSILKSSQKANCLLEKKLAKVSLCHASERNSTCCSKIKKKFCF